jgi:hypothetical protein
MVARPESDFVASWKAAGVEMKSGTFMLGARKFGGR